MINYKKKMRKIAKANLPGFYLDERGAYGVVLGEWYICCSVNMEDGLYDVTVDAVGDSGLFDNNVEWESYEMADDAILRLCEMVRKYGYKR